MSSSSTTPVIEDAAVKALLTEHEFLEVIETGEGDQKRVRVRCELTQHELLPRADAIATHLKSKKFLKAKEWYCYDYSKYEPYIVSHRRKPKSLFCNVTNTVLNRIPSEVEKHVSGKKFQRLKEHANVLGGRKQRSNGDKSGESKQEGGGDEEEEDFDANAFEFENAQVLLSDDEDAVDGGDGAVKGAAAAGKKKPQNDSDDDEEDEELEDDDEEGDDEEDSDMAEFYPGEDDDDDDEGRIDHETVVKLTKRKAEDEEGEGEDAMQPPAAKKQKKPQPQVSKARMSSKDRRQQPKHQKASFKK